MGRLQRIPDFKTDAEAARWWDTHSATDYWHELTPAPNIKFARSLRHVIRVPINVTQLDGLKRVASRKGLRYRELLRRWINERLAQERRGRPRPATHRKP